MSTYSPLLQPTRLGRQALIEITITANDVNENPTVADEDGNNVYTTAEIDSTPTDGSGEPIPNYVYATFTLAATFSKDDPDEDDETTFRLTGDDASVFDLMEDENNAGTYNLTFKEPPDFDSPMDANRDNSYMVSVVATDKAGLMGMEDVTITVTEVPEDGKVTLSTTQPAVGRPITAMLSDPDNNETGLQWQWQRSGDGTTFTVIEGATSATYIPADDDADTEADESDEGMYLRAMVSYRDDASTETEDLDSTPDVDESLTESAMGDSDLAVREAPATNADPVFESGITLMVEENSKPGDDVGDDPVEAMDADDDELTYEISGGADMDAFTIHMNTGQVKVGEGTELDYEMGQRTYEIEVTAKDPFGGSGSTMVTIMVTDVNERPVLMLVVPDEPVTPTMPTITVMGDATVDYAENGTEAVETYTSSEAGATWSLSGEDMDDFSISSDGVLSFMSSPDFEAETDANNDNVYMVTVTAMAAGATDGSLEVAVTVTDVDEGTNGNGNGAFDPLSYDANENGVIDRPEVITAIRHYFDDQITRDDVLAVIKAYFNGS